MFAHGEEELRDKKVYLPPEASEKRIMGITDMTHPLLQVLLRKSQLCRHFMGTGVCWLLFRKILQVAMNQHSKT